MRNIIVRKSCDSDFDCLEKMLFDIGVEGVIQKKGDYFLVGVREPDLQTVYSELKRRSYPLSFEGN